MNGSFYVSFSSFLSKDGWLPNGVGQLVIVTSFGAVFGPFLPLEWIERFPVSLTKAWAVEFASLAKFPGDFCRNV